MFIYRDSNCPNVCSYSNLYYLCTYVLSYLKITFVFVVRAFAHGVMDRRIDPS